MDEEGRRVPVIAKVEKPQAVANMEGRRRGVRRGDGGPWRPRRRVPARRSRWCRSASWRCAAATPSR
ncbi:hypothetical protein [Streptomyces sp. KL116D]|uniref:hypothetical protein n=1 Tax=Streptomyces sp. KL116D TaxID=3045152 RepID=UPI003557E5DF